MTIKDKIGYWIVCYGNIAMLLGALISMAILTIFMSSCSVDKISIDAAIDYKHQETRDIQAEETCDLESPPCISKTAEIIDFCMSSKKIAKDRCERECYLCSEMTSSELICTNYYGVNCVSICGICN